MNDIIINTSETALVIIDLQKGIVERETAPYASRIVIQNAAVLATEFRKIGVPIFLVRVTPSPDGKDALHPIADVAIQTQALPSGWADIVPEIGPMREDFVITKHQWGAFYGTELDLELRRRGIKTIVLCGIATNIGVESTARFAYEYGYQQIFVEDAMSALSADEHMFTVTKIFPRIGRVRKTNELINRISKHLK